MFFQFGEIPQEIQEMIDRRHMEEQVTRRDLDSLIETLPIEQLMIVRTMVRIVHNAPESAAFFEGQIYARLKSEGLCPECGQTDHDVANLASMQYEVLPESGSPEVQGQMVIPGTEFTEEQHRQMNEYHLDDLRDEDSHQLLGFICTNCGMQYRSIEDRMLKGPDDCHGCHLKSAHG